MLNAAAICASNLAPLSLLNLWPTCARDRVHARSPVAASARSLLIPTPRREAGWDISWDVGLGGAGRGPNRLPCLRWASVEHLWRVTVGAPVGTRDRSRAWSVRDVRVATGRDSVSQA